LDTIAATLEIIPMAISGTPGMLKFATAATANSPYETSQRTIAARSGVRQGRRGIGNATIWSVIPT